MSRLTVSALVLIFVTVQTVSALQCWKCSSDIDRTCNDPFNGTEILSRRGGRMYDNYDQRQYDSNYNQNYNPNYNPSYNPNFNNLNRQTPYMEMCDDNEAGLRRMKNVCIKKVIKASNYVSIVRQCAMIGLNEEVGSCHDPVAGGRTLEFCEYCNRDGCNSATDSKTNIVLASLLSFIVILVYRY